MIVLLSTQQFLSDAVTLAEGCGVLCAAQQGLGAWRETWPREAEGVDLRCMQVLWCGSQQREKKSELAMPNRQDPEIPRIPLILHGNQV